MYQIGYSSEVFPFHFPPLFYMSAISIEYMTSHEQGENRDHNKSSKTCKVCQSSYDHANQLSLFGICERCGFKILIVLMCALIIISYVWWFGVIR